MISTNKIPDDDDPFKDWLMNIDIKPNSTKIPSNKLLNEAIQKKKASTNKTYRYELTGNNLINKNEKEKLINLMDIIYNQKNKEDIKITFGDKFGEKGKEAFCALLGFNSGNLYERLISFHKSYDSISLKPKIALRRMQGPINGCISFHCDGGYASETVQLSLNDDSEYVGGRLCFITGNGLSVPSRPSGALTVHERNVLHGVTKMHSGVRYSLFVVDKPNGLGEKDVVCLSKNEIEDIMNTNECVPF